MTDERNRRVGLNEAMFRRVNEEIESLNERLGGGDGTMQIVCECCDEQCAERFEITLADYERVRGDARRFALIPGHEDRAAETVVERGRAYVVVQKTAKGAEQAAEETDPRS